MMTLLSERVLEVIPTLKELEHSFHLGLVCLGKLPELSRLHYNLKEVRRHSLDPVSLFLGLIVDYLYEHPFDIFIVILPRSSVLLLTRLRYGLRCREELAFDYVDALGASPVTLNHIADYRLLMRVGAALGMLLAYLSDLHWVDQLV